MRRGLTIGALALGVLTLGLGAIGAVAPADASAQEAPVSLDRVEELTRMGRTEDARHLLLEWWDTSYAKASRQDVQHALWLRGSLTVDPAQAELDYQRLVTEYPGGPFSDQALLRLAQAAFVRGDSATAAQDVARIAREYRGSATARSAQAWLASAGPVIVREQPGPGQPPDTVSGAVAALPPDVRGTPPDTLRSGKAAEPDSLTAAAAPPAPAAGTVISEPDTLTAAARPPRTEYIAPQPRFAVQLGAFADRGRAETLRRRAATAGFDARLVLIPGSDLVRVRVGAFDEEQEADAILRRLKASGFTAAVARDAHLEKTIR